MDKFKKYKALTFVPPTWQGDPLCAGRANISETLATIKTYWEKHNYLLDPHTAVGVHVAQENLSPDFPMICLATAHPAKFGDAVTRATGDPNLARHPILDALSGLPTRCEILPPETFIVRDFVQKNV